MARLFSIYFDFRGTPYTAMVSVHNTPFFTEYVINQFDERLIHMLPGNRIISTPSGAYKFLNSDGIQPTVLMDTILRAVSTHLQRSEV